MLNKLKEKGYKEIKLQKMNKMTQF